MSSPIAKSVEGFLKKALIKFHQSASHNHRIEILSDLLAKEIDNLGFTEPIKCLDIGCGDMLLSEKINQKLKIQSNWNCIDIHQLPENFKSITKWDKYSQFDGKNIPFGDNQFDAIIICDVLHHDMENAIQLLTESKRVGKYTLVKDHYEFGFFSRTILRLMDFVGNWAYGVSVPNYYFNKKEFFNICDKIGLLFHKEIDQIKLYKHSKLYNFISNEKWQFLAILCKIRQE